MVLEYHNTNFQMKCDLNEASQYSQTIWVKNRKGSEKHEEEEDGLRVKEKKGR